LLSNKSGKAHYLSDQVLSIPFIMGCLFFVVCDNVHIFYTFPL